jgi:heat shock protein HslJ
MTPRLLLLSLVATLLSSCGIGDLSGDLDGDWVLETGTVDGARLQPIGDTRISLQIEGSTVGGIAACNHYGGEIERDGDRISFGAMSTTEMGCDQPVMALESAYVAALGRVDRAARDGDRMRLSGAGVELDFSLVQPLADANPIGTNWVLESLILGDSVSSVMGDASLRLDADGTLSGSTGCRSFDASYRIEGGTLEVQDWIIDMRPCGADNAGQDGHVQVVLEGLVTIAVSGDRLTLMVGDRGLDYRVGD